MDKFLEYLEKKITLVEPFTFLIIDYLATGKEYINNSDVLNKYKEFFDIKRNFEKHYLLNRIFEELMEDEILEKINNCVIEMLTVQNLDRIMQKYNKKKEKLK